MPERDDLAARIVSLERENAELRAHLAEHEERARESRPSRPHLELITKDEARRSRFAKLMLAGGGIAILGGIFASSWFALICGLGWLLGGAAVASTVPESRGDA